MCAGRKISPLLFVGHVYHSATSIDSVTIIAVPVLAERTFTISRACGDMHVYLKDGTVGSRQD